MGNAIWKLTCLVGIAGLGFLILVQAQQGLHEQNQHAHAQGQVPSSSEEDAAPHSATGDSSEDAPSPPTTIAGDAPTEPTPESAARAITWHTDPASSDDHASGGDELVTIAQKKPAGTEAGSDETASPWPGGHSSRTEDLAAAGSSSPASAKSGQPDFVPLPAKENGQAVPFRRNEEAQPDIVLAGGGAAPTSPTASPKPGAATAPADLPEATSPFEQLSGTTTSQKNAKASSAAPLPDEGAGPGLNPFAAAMESVAKPDETTAAKPAADLAPPSSNPAGASAPAGADPFGSQPESTETRPTPLSLDESPFGKPASVESSLGNPSPDTSHTSGYDSGESAEPASSLGTAADGPEASASPFGAISAASGSAPLETSPFSPNLNGADNSGEDKEEGKTDPPTASSKDPAAGHLKRNPDNAETVPSPDLLPQDELSPEEKEMSEKPTTSAASPSEDAEPAPPAADPFAFGPPPGEMSASVDKAGHHSTAETTSSSSTTSDQSEKPADPFAVISGIAGPTSASESAVPKEELKTAPELGSDSNMSSNSSFNAKDPPAGDAEASDPFSWGPMTDSSAGDAVSSADPVADVGSDGDEAATGDDPPNSPEPPPAESGAPTSAPDPFAALAAARLGESGSAEEKPSEEIPSSEEPLSEEPANDKPAEESEGTPSASEADADSAPFGMSPSAGGTSPFGSGKAETRPEPLGSSMTPPSPSSEKTPEPETPNEPETPKLASPPAESASPFGGETNDENASSHASSNLSPPTPHHTPRATRHAHSESPAPAGGEPPAPTKKTLDETTPATPPVALGGNGPGPSVLPALDDEASAAGGAGTIVTDAPASQYAAELTVEKKAPARAVLGKPVVYEIVVTNVGQRPAKEVTVSDVVPAGAKLQGTIPRAVMKQDRLTWKLGTLAVNESSSIRIKVIPTEPGTIGSVATVDFLTTTPPARTRVVEPKLSLSLTAPKTVPVGKIIAFDFEIANTGSAPARNVTLRNLLPSGFRHADGNDLEYEVGLLAPGAVQHVTLRAAAVKAGQFSNQAFLTGAGGLKTEAAATVQVIGKPLSLSRTGPQRRLVGREAVYTNTLQNNSSRQVGSATVIETIPPGMTFVSATGGGQFDHQQHRVVWNVGPLAPGEQTQLAVTLEATQQGTQRSTVRIEEINRGQSVQVTSATDVLVPEQLASTIGGPEETLVVGERTAFAIHLANGGAAPADHVLVSLTLPRQLKFVEARGGESSSSTPGVTTVHPSEPIPPGEEHRITFVVEAIAAGQNTLRASIDAAQLTTPLVREAEFQVVAARS